MDNKEIEELQNMSDGPTIILIIILIIIVSIVIGMDNENNRNNGKVD